MKYSAIRLGHERRETITARCDWFTDVIRDIRKTLSEAKYGEELLPVDVARRLMTVRKKLNGLTAPDPS